MMKNLSRIRKRQLPPPTEGTREENRMYNNATIDGGSRGGNTTANGWRLLLVLLATMAATSSEAFFLSHSPSISSAPEVRILFGDQRSPFPHHRRQLTSLFSAVVVKKDKKKQVSDGNSVIHRNGRHQGSRPEKIRIQYVNKKKKWTQAEEQYVEGLISEFSSGELPIEANITLSKYLATKLNCTQQRIWYKFGGNPIYDGKLKYVCNGCNGREGRPKDTSSDENAHPVHTSHWTKAEEKYAETLISDFSSGQSLEIEEGTTLVSYLATKLACNPKRIWKKFGGDPIFDGKVKYVLTSTDPGKTKKKGRDKVRKGPWTPAEEMYAKRLMSDFRSGQLPAEEEGTTLASYLAKKLHCNPQRIWKKFGGNPIYNGKVKYVCNRSSTEEEDARDTNKKKKNAPLRKGHWTLQEQQYAEGLISEFKSGQLPIEEGTTLSSYLATMLNCSQKRVWNKFGGNPIYDGKAKYVNSRDPLPPEELIAGQESLLELKRKFDARPRKKFGLGGKREGAGRPRSRIQKERKRKPKKKRLTFSVMFKKLSDYYHEHGHSLVSADDDDVELYKWTRSIRKNYRHQVLQQVRPKEPAATRKKKKTKKGNKAKQQQHKTRRPMLSESKTAMLQTVEFCWDVQEAAWQQKYQQLSDFRERYGHCDLGSPLLAEDQALAVWLQNQRRDYRLWLQDLSNPLTPDRLEALENLGVFEVFKTQQEAWGQHYQYLVEYHQQFGNVDVPQDYRHPVTINVIDDIDHQVHARHTSFALGCWCMNQRRNRKFWDVLQEEDHNKEEKGRKKKRRKKETKSSSSSPSDGAYELITTERIRLLNALDFPWNARDTRWHAMLQRLTDYYQTHGHLKIATNDVANQDLRQWLIIQRHYYQRQRKNTPQSSPMTETRIASMEEAIPNFSWKVFNNTGPSTEDWSNLFDAMRDKGLAPDARPKQHWFEGQNTVAMEVKSEWTEQELIDLWHQDGEDDEEDDDDVDDSLSSTPFANGEGGGLNYFVDVEDATDPLGTPDSFYGKQKASKSWQWKAHIEKGGFDDDHDDDEDDDEDDFNFFVNLKDTAAALAKSSGVN